MKLLFGSDNSKQNSSYELVQKAESGNESAVDELCNSIYNATAGRLGTDEATVDAILQSSSNETKAKIMDRYSEVTGSEIYKDIQNDYSGKAEREIIDALSSAYQEVNEEEYTGYNDGKLNNGQIAKSVGKGLLNKIPNALLTVGGVIVGKTAIGACISGAAGAALTTVFGAGAAVVATVAAPVVAVAGVATAGYMIYKGVTKTNDAIKDGQNATDDETAQNAVTDGTEGVVDIGLGAYTGYESVKALGQSVKNIKECNAVQRTQQIQSENDIVLEEELPSLSSEESTAAFGEYELTDEEIELARKLNAEEMASLNDDWVFGYDDGVYGNEGLSSDAVREDMRERILSKAALTDENLAVKPMDLPDEAAAQLAPESKYFTLGEARLNNKTNEYVHICENLKDMPDYNGVRGKTPLSGRNAKGLKFRLGKVQQSGINTVIDLRSKGECTAKAMQALDELGMNYVNFPVEDGNWTMESLNEITDYIGAINSGDFYVGCANGQARTDLAVAINYVFNPNASTTPALYYGSASSSRVSVKDNISQIFNLIGENPNVVQNWGWGSYDEFMAQSGGRMTKLLQSLK